MAEQPPKPDHVKAMEQIKAKSEEVTQIIDTIEHSKGKHYHLAVEKLRDSKTKRINYKLLDASKYGDYYHHKVADEFINNLKKDVREMYHMKDDYKMSDSEANLLLGGVYEYVAERIESEINTFSLFRPIPIRSSISLSRPSWSRSMACSPTSTR